MKALRALALLATLAISGAAQAQSGFTSEDNAVMLACFETVADAAEVDAGGGASLHDCIGAASNACKATEYSAEGEAACNAREQSWWENRLDGHLVALNAGLPAPTAESLRKTQDAWLDYRDARCDYGNLLWGSSGLPITSSFCWLILTAERAIDLSFDLSAVAE
jgi:uncharacterized protein YecT (DUF1311 family)